MIVVGFILVGLAVGADIPASWSLIAEMAPARERGKHSGVAQVLWYLGPVVVLVMFLALARYGVLGAPRHEGKSLRDIERQRSAV